MDFALHINWSIASTLCSSIASMALFLSKMDKFLTVCREQSLSTNAAKALDRMPSIAKKRLWRKKFKRHLLSSRQKTTSTQTSGSVFAERIEQVKKSKFELDLIKIVDCFLDGYGSYDGNYVSFKIKYFINQPFFSFTQEV